MYRACIVLVLSFSVADESTQIMFITMPHGLQSEGHEEVRQENQAGIPCALVCIYRDMMILTGS